MLPFEDPSTLSLLYHLNSEPWLNTEAYQGSAYEVEYRTVARPESALALPVAPTSPLQTLLQERCSCRRFQSRTMPLATVAALLAAAYGLGRTARFPDQTSYLCRNVPSAGGLYPLEIFVLIQRVEGA